MTNKKHERTPQLPLETKDLVAGIKAAQYLTELPPRDVFTSSNSAIARR